MDRIAGIWSRVQRSLFPHLQECLPALTERHREVVLVLETICIEEYVQPGWMHWLGRKPKDRRALARSFVAKAVYNEPNNKSFRDRLRMDESLRRICGWERRCDIPSESTFSRAFGEFAETALADRVHKARVKEYLGEDVIWPMEPDRDRRYNNRTTVERFNSRLKDGCGGRMVRVRGKPKVHAHLMFGVLVIFAEALLSLAN